MPLHVLFGKRKCLGPMGGKSYSNEFRVWHDKTASISLIGNAFLYWVCVEKLFLHAFNAEYTSHD